MSLTKHCDSVPVRYFAGLSLNRCRVKCSVNYWRTISNCKSITINHWMYRNSMKMLI